MPIKKSKRDKKRKARLSDKDIIKLLKKLRPKTQQIVRVNVGDKAEKGDKKGASAFQPNIVPVLTYGQPFQPPFQPPPPVPPPPPARPLALPPALPVSQQPQYQPLLPPPPPAARRQTSFLLTDTEAETETPVKVRKTRTSRKAAETAEQGYIVQPPREPRFKAPRGYVGSSLGATASEPSYFQPPVQNDPYLPSITIFDDDERDNAGVVSQPLSSDQWIGTPEGSITEFPVASESAGATAELPPLETVPAPEETFAGRTIGSQSKVDKIRAISAASVFAEEEPDWTKNIKLGEEFLPPAPPESEIRPAAAAAAAAAAPLFEGEVDPLLFNRVYGFDYMDKLVRDAPTIARDLMKNEIVEKLKGGFTGVPKEFLTKTGRLRTKLDVNQLFNLYMDL